MKLSREYASLFEDSAAFGEIHPEPKRASNPTAERILSIIQAFGPADAREVHRPVFEESVRRAVTNNKPIQMVLPAFPFKSPNHREKTLGNFPDLGEELALARLDSLRAQVCDVYPDTEITIVSDGLVYNDLLGVSEEDVFRYGMALRELAAEKFPLLKFARLRDLYSEVVNATTLEEYVANSSYCREKIMRDFLPPGFDAHVAVRDDINVLTTYRGYIKFLESDLCEEPSRQGLSKKKVKHMNEATARAMITRGAAFSAAVKFAFPDAVRISIHASHHEYKMPISLLPGKTCGYTTPWHSATAMEQDGSFHFGHRDVFDSDENYELVYRHGRPSYFRRKSELYNWGTDVEIHPIYPCGLMITPKGPAALQDIEMRKVRGLAEYNSPVVMRGFRDTKDLESFKGKAREMGTILPWKFGEVLVVKDGGAETMGLNDVLSSEPMPMHFDGLFKTKKIDVAGVEKLVPQAPQFQFFTVVTPSPENSGLTLFASSRLFFEHLPGPYSLSQLRALTWSVETPAFNHTRLSELDLVVPHPTLQTPCLRYHEPWGRDKTRFDPTAVHIADGAHDHLLPVIDALLYDRRVCYSHEWREGDLIVSDNINMLHTRSGFEAGEPRELWRIHVE
ncbi:uncharacterized protein L3040_003039 [Drepanopeziza brunnea f. sp. 'multigermtubi']|uniref:TauD/TfdA-like domain-containing protein n=1 Tax=Marssonina brunnea f. sp. multigermtubi (strain MB_m1) TaxID=1072389 RepID=K1WX21_MARBU|nr:uncharacterized protein MBM_08681 [Drepanopeziza brunnea f. sp. 'multigermtubi' MB_m1]EKD13238.1 hypothetical protein MBM_08681 [Drepanopeziza brunnea f. sp. 'multigermtubi' MB_m1]KAJ5047198.1 hypothetical protein L3040_003039 [Drepanopeziza brunnea f. sp. 'multigermtubi']